MKEGGGENRDGEEGRTGMERRGERGWRGGENGDGEEGRTGMERRGDKKAAVYMYVEEIQN